jgi:pyruvate/2-oxoglutarate dehydrogenase complex dihydrolipoamide dehydrogenase (E3) component
MDPDVRRPRRADDAQISPSTDPQPHRVVIVGGGTAALEAVLALHDLSSDDLA